MCRKLIWWSLRFRIMMKVSVNSSTWLKTYEAQQSSSMNICFSCH